jgi:excinuclease UvrABC ATPase subunit
MVNKRADTRFLAVVGTSGSRKSSLVNCGLRPALRQGLMARAGTAWRMA